MRRKRTLAALLLGMACTGVSQAADPVAEWNFDAQTLVNSGTTAGEHDGLIVSGESTNYTAGTAVFTSDTPSGTGYALDLTSTSQYMLITNSSSYFGDGYTSTFDDAADFSYSMWIKNTDGTWTDWNEMAGKGSEANHQGWAMRSKYSNTTRVSFYHNTEGDDDALDGTGVSITDDVWHLYTFTYDSTAGALILYIDGAEVGADTSAVMADAIDRALVFGGRDDGTRIDRVLFDSIQFYDVALSSNEVAGLYIDQTSVFTDVDEIELELISPDTAVTGSVAVSYISEFDIDVDVSLSNASHTGFSLLTTVPFTMTDPDPSNTTVEIEFDQTLAGTMTNGEIASCTAVIAWNKNGESEVTEILIPVSVEYKEAIEKGTPILWDIGNLTDADNVNAAVSNFVEAGVTESLTGAFVSNVQGSQNMTDGFITVDLSAYKSVNAPTLAYSGEGAAIMREYVYTKSQDAVITIGGLSDRLVESTEYCLYLWGKGDAWDQNATFTFEETSITTSTNDPVSSDATNFMAKFSFTTDAVVADTLTINWDRAESSTYTGFNGFAIVPKYALNPTVGDIAMEIISGGTKAVLTFETVSGATYGVQYKGLLTDSTWTSIADSIDGTGGDVTVTNTMGDGPEFYRAYVVE